MSDLKEIWVTKTYVSFNDKEFVFIMGFSAASMDHALRQSLGDTKYESLDIVVLSNGEWLAQEIMPSGNVNRFHVIEGPQPPLPPHKNWSVWDNRCPMHQPILKTLKKGLFK